MQILMIALCLAGFGDDGNLHTAGLPGWSPVDASIEFDVLNTWTISWADQVLGLATWESGSTVNIIYAESSGMELGSLDPATGSSAGSVPKPAGCGNGFGVVFNDNLTTPIWHINSWGNSNLYYTEDNFSTWQTVSNPCGTGGRGMSFDEDEYYWQSNSTSLVRFIPGGASTSFSGAAPTQISGVAVVPGENPSYIYVLVTTYNTDTFILWSYDGASMTQVATGVTPSGLGNSNRLGLTWCPSRESLFFAYAVSGGYKISELDFQVVSLTRDTWAGIKSAF
jgi:hypothetical protein